MGGCGGPDVSLLLLLMLPLLLPLLLLLIPEAAVPLLLLLTLLPGRELVPEPTRPTPGGPAGGRPKPSGPCMVLQHVAAGRKRVRRSSDL